METVHLMSLEFIYLVGRILVKMIIHNFVKHVKKFQIINDM